jgi:hypothetical protein
VKRKVDGNDEQGSDERYDAGVEKIFMARRARAV